MDYTALVSNVNIYDLEESLVASGYPMRTKAEMRELTPKDYNRGEALVKATLKGNTAHHQFLTGIRVNFDLTFTNKVWVEAERYRFLEFVSSQSTMHRITKFDLDSQYIKYVDPRCIEVIREKVNEYNAIDEELKAIPKEEVEKRKEAKARLDEKFLEIVYSNPAGFKLTARMTTNYRCLRNIYIQRKDHPLPEWRAFCKWIETLPYADIFLTNIEWENQDED
jgi:hypothetical protein